MTTTSRFKHLYDFLVTRERTSEAFSIQEVADATGYAPSSVRTHLSKKLGGYLVFETGHDHYIAEGVAREFSRAEFVEYMSQKSRRVQQSPADRIAETMMHRAGDAFELALESYQRRSLRHRVQTFCLLMVDAWEMLLKGEWVEARGTDAIERPPSEDPSPEESDDAPPTSDQSGDDRSGDTPTIRSLEDMLSLSYNDEGHPVRHNILHLLNLCDQREYLLVPDLEPAVVPLFRAAASNFRRRYRGTMDEDPVAHAPAQIAFRADATSVNLDVLRQRYGHRTYERAKRYLDRLEADRDQHDSRRFAVSNAYRLALVRRLDDEDIPLSSES